MSRCGVDISREARIVLRSKHQNVNLAQTDLLTERGAERKLFFFALMMGAGVFNLLHTFFGGILMFCLLYAFARWATRTDSQMLRLVLNSARLRVQYDPAKLAPTPVRKAHHV